MTPRCLLLVCAGLRGCALADPVAVGPASVEVPVADFAKAALAVYDNFRVAAFYERGAKDFPEDTHFDGLDWVTGFTEAWLYALRSARIALRGSLAERLLADTTPESVSDALRGLAASEAELASAWRVGQERRLRAAWADARDLLGPGSRARALLQELAALQVSLRFPRDAADPFGLLGVAWPREPVRMEDLRVPLTLTNGVRMPRWGLGTTMLNGREGEDVMTMAIRGHGYRLIDSAQAYRNEAQVGRAIERSGVNRSDVFVVTKISDEKDMSTKERVRSRIRKQLAMLKTDHIDLYFIHGPDRGWRRAWRVMEELYRQGTLRALGLSNFNAAQLREWRSKAAVSPHAIQNKFSIYHHGDTPTPRESLLEAAGAGLAFMGYCNLDVYPAVLEPMKDPHVASIAAALNLTVAQVLLRHALQMGTVVIPKTAGTARLAENANPADGRTLSPDEMLRLNALAQLVALDPLAHVADLYGVHTPGPRGGPPGTPAAKQEL